MQMNITLNAEQTESVKQSVFSTLTPNDLASQLFTQLAMLRLDTKESKELQQALVNFLAPISK